MFRLFCLRRGMGPEQQKQRGVIGEMTTYLQGREYPDVPLAAGVDYETLVEGDPDPFFITLQIGEVNAESRNGRTYPREAVEAIASAVNMRRVHGILGHLRSHEISYEMRIPVLHWVGAVMEGDFLWGKAYVPPEQSEVRGFLRTQMRTGSRVGTSIFGSAMIDEDGMVSDLYVETIDLAHADRVGVPQTAMVPLLTKETADVAEGDEPAEGSQIENSNAAEGGELSEQVEAQENDTMPEQDKIKTPVAESNGAGEIPRGYVPLGEVTELKDKHADSVRELRGQIAELEDKLRTHARMVELLGDPEDPTAELSARLKTVKALETENASLLEGYIKTAVADKVKLNAGRGIVETFVKAEKPASRDAIDAAVETVIAREEVQAILKLKVQEQAGPNQTRPVVPVTESAGEDGAPAEEATIRIPW